MKKICWNHLFKALLGKRGSRCSNKIMIMQKTLFKSKKKVSTSTNSWYLYTKIHFPWIIWPLLTKLAMKYDRLKLTQVRFKSVHISFPKCSWAHFLDLVYSFLMHLHQNKTFETFFCSFLSSLLNMLTNQSSLTQRRQTDRHLSLTLEWNSWLNFVQGQHPLIQTGFHISFS